MQYNECSICGANKGRAGHLVGNPEIGVRNACLNCFDTTTTGDIVIHSDLNRTAEELQRTFNILNVTKNNKPMGELQILRKYLEKGVLTVSELRALFKHNVFLVDSAAIYSTKYNNYAINDKGTGTVYKAFIDGLLLVAFKNADSVYYRLLSTSKRYSPATWEDVKTKDSVHSFIFRDEEHCGDVVLNSDKTLVIVKRDGDTTQYHYDDIFNAEDDEVQVDTEQISEDLNLFDQQYADRGKHQAVEKPNDNRLKLGGGLMSPTIVSTPTGKTLTQIDQWINTLVGAKRSANQVKEFLKCLVQVGYIELNILTEYDHDKVRAGNQLLNNRAKQRRSKGNS